MMKDKKVVKLKKNSFFKNSIFIPFIILITALIILAFSPLFDIKQLKIEGNLRLTENSIIKVSGIELNSNILRLNKNIIKENIRSLPYVESVSIRRSWPDTVTIFVTEKDDFAKLEVLGSVITVDENGMVLQAFSDGTDIDLPLIDGIEVLSYGVNKTIETSSQDEYNNILEVLKIFKKNDMLNVIERILQDSNIIIYTKDGHVINVGDVNDLEYKCKRLKAVLEVEKDEKYYFDISNINIYPVSKPLWAITQDEVVE